jgi:hypothetical protein
MMGIMPFLSPFFLISGIMVYSWICSIVRSFLSYYPLESEITFLGLHNYLFVLKDGRAIGEIENESILVATSRSTSTAAMPVHGVRCTIEYCEEIRQPVHDVPSNTG